MAVFDAASALTMFLQDTNSSCLELPHMTTGQRKNMKKLLEGHPDLRCESYGFGQERQLHIFKKQPNETSSKVKNQSLQFESGKCSGDCSSEASTADCSSEASDNYETAPAIGGGSSVTCRELVCSIPAATWDIQVRNTFIHLEQASSDDRAVQSMPHGMFKQCILDEALDSSHGCYSPISSACATPTSVSDLDLNTQGSMLGQILDSQSSSLSPGALVVVEGLVKVPSFNGRSAVVQGFDSETGRYNILLASADGSQHAKVKQENLRLVLPCP